MLELTEERLVGDDQLGHELVLLDRLLGVLGQRPLLALGGRVVGRLVLVGEQLPDLLEAHARRPRSRPRCRRCRP